MPACLVDKEGSASAGCIPVGNLLAVGFGLSVWAPELGCLVLSVVSAM